MVEAFNRELTEISDCVLAITGGRVDSKLEGTFYAYGETDDAALKRMIVRFVKTAVCQTIDPAEQMGAYEELRAMIDAEINRLKRETRKLQLPGIREIRATYTSV